MPKKRILLAGLFHETNTFAPGGTGLSDFEIRRGDALFAARGDGSPLGAFLEEAQRCGWEVIPVVDARATPGPMPAAEMIQLAFRELEAALDGLRDPNAKPLDAIFLILHGAMAAPGLPDVEGELLARVHRHPAASGVPVFGVLDLHANFTQAMADHSNALLVYRKNPHTDAAETAARAARLLEKTFLSPLSLRTRFVATDLLWPPTGTGTAAAPMATLEALARGEERDGIEEINVFAGFSHADTPQTGVSFSIVYDPSRVPAQRLDAVAQRLKETAEAEKELGLPDEWELDAAIADAQAKGVFPVCLVEPADNIGGGTAGDGTAILRALLRHKAAGSGVILNDPETVAALAGKEPGSVHSLEVGGKGFGGDPGPVPVRAKLLRLTGGQFLLDDRHSHLASLCGVRVEMGPCALLDADGILILLTSRRTPPMDLGQWLSQGVDPAALRFIGVKAAVAHRQAYDRIAKASYWVRTPGPCASDLRSLPYRLVRRPVFPLD